MKQAETEGKTTETMTDAPTLAGPEPEPSIASRLARLFRRVRLTAETANPLDSGSDVWAPLRHELSRSRRYERSFVLIRIDGDTAARAAGEVDPDLLTERAHRTRALVRDVDVTWVADGHVYVLLPECERPEGERFLERIVRDAPAVFSARDVRLACFPADGCTSGALLAVLEGQPLPAVRPQSAHLRAVNGADRGDTRAVAHGKTP